MVLRDLCDLDYAEIAEVLDVPPGTVRSRISRGRARRSWNALDPDTAREPGALSRTSERRWLTTTRRARRAVGRSGSSAEPLDDVDAPAAGLAPRCASRRGDATRRDAGVRWIADRGRDRRRARGRARRGHGSGRRATTTSGDPGPNPLPAREAGGERAVGPPRSRGLRRRPRPQSACDRPPVDVGDFGDLDQRRQPRPAPAAALAGAARPQLARRQRPADRRAAPSACARAPRAATGSRPAPSSPIGTGHPRRRRRRRSCSPSSATAPARSTRCSREPCEVRPLS